jgi:predicted GNAT family acetyltransferase
MNAMSNAVVNNAEKNRFELGTPAGPAIADYRLDGGVVTIFHTEVPEPLRGRGIGGLLVEGALSEIRRLNLKVVPSCWFVREFIDRNPRFSDLLK